MKRYSTTRLLSLAGVAAVVAVVAAAATHADSKRYVSMDNAVHQVFTGIPSEQTLIDFCYRLRDVRGVTGVGYRDYSAHDGRAVITVFYNPQMTTVRQLRILMSYPYILWEKPLSS
jgi:hypothetical protein